jgi:hypothetical protein
MKKRNKKYNPNKAAHQFQTGKLHLSEVDILLEPFFTFFKQLKNQSLWINEKTGDILMDLVNLRVEEASKKGEEPALAAPKFYLLFETYFQAMTFHFGTCVSKSIQETVLRINKTIFIKLDSDIAIDKSDILFAEQFLSKIKLDFMTIPRNKMSRVKNEIRKAIFKSSENDISSAALREWLSKELGVVT